MKAYHVEVHTLDPGIYNAALETAHKLGGSREAGDFDYFVARFEDSETVKAFLDFLVERVRFFKMEVF